MTVKEFDGTQCGESLALGREAWRRYPAVSPVAVVGPGGTTCVKSVASNDPHVAGLRTALRLERRGRHVRVVDGHERVSDRYPTRTWCASRAPRTRSARGCWLWHQIRLGPHAIVYDATDEWASDTANVLSENLGRAGIATLGDKCVSSVVHDLRGGDRPKKGIRFDEDPHWGNGLLTASVADRILDELDDIDAKIIYMITARGPARCSSSGSSRRRSAGAGYASFPGGSRRHLPGRTDK